MSSYHCPNPRSHRDNAFARVASPAMRTHSGSRTAGIHIYNAHATQRDHQSQRSIKRGIRVLLHVHRGMRIG